MGGRILIVEDDEHIAKYIDTCLNIGGYTGEICHDGAAAVELAAGRRFDLILLDVMLPGLDGFAVQESVREYGIPVIFLTAVGDVADKVRGLKAGAEDYIVKPFEALELLARIEVVLRRGQKEDTILCYRDVEVDTKKHTVKRKGQVVALSPKEFDVLVFFLRHQDVVVSRGRLLAEIWEYGFEGETRTVDTHVQQVRRKLGLQGGLVTVPKYGYRLIKE